MEKICEKCDVILYIHMKNRKEPINIEFTIMKEFITTHELLKENVGSKGCIVIKEHIINLEEITYVRVSNWTGIE